MPKVDPTLVNTETARECSKCRVVQTITEFIIRANRGTREWWCRSCRNTHQNAHRNKAYVSPGRRYVIELKESSPCTDCGKYYSYWIMEFDHIKEKWKSINFLYSYSIDTLKKEIAKCELVCANCHADRTYKRMVSLL